MFDKTIRQVFQRAALTYDSAALLAREIGDRLIEHLDWMRLKPQRILDLGAGTGYISRLLRERYPVADIINVDFAQNMLRQTKSTACVCADAMKLPFMQDAFDLVVSNLMLPWCEQLPEILAETHRVLQPSGLFLFSSFGPDALGELRASWATVDDMPHVHLFLDQHDIGDALLHAHFADPIMQAEWLTLTYQKITTLFSDLKNSGAQNVLRERRQTLTGKHRFQRFLAEYDTYRDEHGLLPATFEIIYGHCWKAQTRKDHPQEFLIAVEDIRR